MKNKQLSIAVLAAVVVAAVFYFTVSDNAPRNTGGAHVTIAVNAPLTGPIAAWSGQFGNGFRMGLEDALRAQQIDPKEFSLDIQDNSGKPEQAVSIFRKQELSGFDVYVTAAAGPVNAVAPLVDATHKPQFLASFDPFITAVAPDRLRVMANSRLDAPLLVSYARTHGAKHVHIIYLNYPNLQEAYASILEPQLKQAGATVTREVFEMDVRDFRSIAEKAKAQAPDLVFVMGFSFHLQALIRDLRVAELVRPGHLVANLDFVDLIYSGTPQAELKDVVFVAPAFDVQGKVATASEWKKQYEARFGVKPTYVPAYAYDNATLIVNAYKKYGTLTAKSLGDATPFNGVNGEVALDQNRDIVATVVLAKVNDSGQIVELTE